MALALGLDLASTVARAQTGDRAAFDAIYERFAEPLFRYLYAQCGDAALAEELAGDLWVRVVERLPSFRLPSSAPEAAFAAWLYRIARNLVIDTFRRRDRRNLPLAETIVARAALPEEQALEREAHRELREAIDKLTPQQREVLLLRFVEERSTAEVALLTGRSQGGVKVMQHRALAALARVLGVRRGQRDES